VIERVFDNTVTLRDGYDLIEVKVKPDLTSDLKPGVFVRCFSDKIEDVGDFEIVGDVRKRLEGVFIGKYRRRFAVAVGNSVWTCIGEVECNRGDVLDLTGFVSKNVFIVLDYKVKGRSEIPNLWTPVSSITPLRTVNIRGRVSGLGFHYTKIKGQTAEIYVSDETGRVKVILWNENAMIYRDLDIGDEIELYNCFPKIGYEGETVVHCGRGAMVLYRV
jgi:replication factor A1